MKRIVVTGMAVNTPLGDTLDYFFYSLIAGKSAITHWRGVETGNILTKVGADLSGYDVEAKLTTLADRVPAEVMKRLRKIVKLATFSTRLTVLCAVDAWTEARLFDIDPSKIAIITGGHNFFPAYDYQVLKDFFKDPEMFDEQYAYKGLDTDQAASVSEVLGITGPIYTLGGACASTSLALRAAVDEIRHHDMKAALVVGPLFDYSPLTLQGLALIGASSFESFNDTPEQASRPFDVRREGFVPAHGTGVMVIESADHALARHAPIHAEVLGVSAVSGANHLPTASAEAEARAIERVLQETDIAPEQVDYINAHATSTPQGDLAEIQAIKTVFGDHAYRLKVNATKSMIGHCCWSSAVVETIAAILQMQHSTLHPTINVEQLDPQIDLDVCASGAVSHPVNIFMKNAFGFGGINSVALFRRFEESL
jgi:3-oxoacyl-(acyl-carrier-protein) synthase